MGGRAHLVLYLADREINAGVDRLSELKNLHGYALDADPDLKLVSKRSPYMRDER
jgi:predicted proteasome-type protease